MPIAADTSIAPHESNVKSAAMQHHQKINSHPKLSIVVSFIVLSACGGGISTPNDGPVSGAPMAGETQGATSGDTDNDSAASADGVTVGATEASTAGASGGATGGSTDNGSDAATSTSTAGEINLAPIVRAPADTEIQLSDTLTLEGSVSNSALGMEMLTIQWEKLSGPGFANFAMSQSAVSSVRFDDVGTYQLQLSASYAGLMASDTMQVVVNSDIVNQPPMVNAGANATIKIDEVLNLAAQADDDGLPNASLSGQWSKVSGPGTVTFGEVSAKKTTATFNAVGQFELQYAANDGELIVSDSITVTVNSATPVASSGNNVNAANAWQSVNTLNGSKPQARHEAGAVAFQNRLYLMGGRGQRQVNRYDPSNDRWENLGVPSMELNHFQPVVHGGKIYVIGSLDCCFPSESVVPTIQIFNPATKTWSTGAPLPNNRRRGSAGAVVYNNKIYLVGGSTNGHDAGMVNWFDEYDPANNQWKTLPNAPTKRDHFNAAVVGNKLVAAGGRQTDHPRTFANLVSKVDVYNFSTGKWSAGASIPTMRAGAMTVSFGDEVIVIGGESNLGRAALKTVEAYNVRTNKWRTLKPLKTERHSGGAAIVGNAIHVVSGNTTTGGGNETQSHEKLNLK